MNASAMTRRWVAGTVAALLLVMSAASCGSSSEDPISPPGGENPPPGDNNPPPPTTGMFQGYVQDDPNVPQGSGSDDTFTGTLSARVDVEISQNGTSWRSLGAPRDITMSLQSSDVRFAVSGLVEVPAGTYSHVRINLNQAGFTIAAGSVVNGVVLNSDVHMRLGDTGSGVAKPNVSAFSLQGGTQANLIVELNTESWLTVRNLESRQVPKEDVEHNVNVMMMVQGG